MESNIWTPEEKLPEIPEVKQVRIKGEILNAKYHPLEKTLMIAVSLPNGESKSFVQYAKSFLFNKRPYDSVPPEEIDKEMEKTAELYRRAKGRKISVLIYENQIKG